MPCARATANSWPIVSWRLAVLQLNLSSSPATGRYEHASAEAVGAHLVANRLAPEPRGSVDCSDTQYDHADLQHGVSGADESGTHHFSGSLPHSERVAVTDRPARQALSGAALSTTSGLLLALTAEEVAAAAALSIRDLEDEVRERLRVRAAQHGRSMEAEIRAILTDAVGLPNESTGLAQALLARFGDLGGVDLDLPPRTEGPRAANLSE